MGKIFASKPFKYALYCLCLLFACLCWPGAHDPVDVKLLVGVLIGNLIFTIWILPLPLLVKIPIGLVVPNLAIVGAFEVEMLLIDRFTLITAVLFYLLSCVFSIVLWEGVMALVRSIRFRQHPS